MEQPAIIKTSIAKQIADQLRGAIVSGQFAVGERLPTEDELSTRYGVSRATVREALKRLAAQNLVRSRRGPAGGNFVKEPTHEELAESLSGAATLLVGLGSMTFEDIIEARRELEKSCLKLALNNADAENLKTIEAALQHQADASLSDETFCAADVAFHRALVDASGNSMLRFVMYTVIEALMPVTNMVVFKVRERQTIVDFHQRLFEALKAKKKSRLNAALDELLDYLLDRYTAAQKTRQQRHSPV